MKLIEKVIKKTQGLPDAGLVNHFFDFNYLSLKNYPDKFTIFGQSEALSEMNKYQEIHNRFCLILTLRGALTTVIEGVPFTAKANQGVLIFPYQNHTFPYEEKDSVLYFVTFEMIDDNEVLPLKNQVINISQKVMLPQVDQLLSTFSLIKENPEKTWEISSILRNILLNGTQMLNEEPVSQIFLELKELFEDEEYLTWKVKEVAAYFDQSPAQMNVICRKFIGISIGEYLRNLRFDYAVKLICDTDLDIGEISRRSGFASFSSFCRQYKKRFEQTPKETRRAFHKKEFRLRYDGFKA